MLPSSPIEYICCDLWWLSLKLFLFFLLGLYSYKLLLRSDFLMMPGKGTESVFCCRWLVWRSFFMILTNVILSKEFIRSPRSLLIWARSWLMWEALFFAFSISIFEYMLGFCYGVSEIFLGWCSGLSKLS